MKTRDVESVIDWVVFIHLFIMLFVSKKTARSFFKYYFVDPEPILAIFGTLMQ